MALTYPYTITAGTDVDAAEVQGNFDANKTYVDTLGTGASDNTWKPIWVPPLAGSVSNFTATTFYPINTQWAATPTVTVHSFYFDDADYTLTGETPVLRLRAQAYTNATAPAVTFTAGLHEITAVAGGASAMSWTINSTAVTGSTVAFASPSASTRNQGVTSAFTVPSDGYYTVGLACSGSQASNSVVAVQMQLQARVAD